MEEISPKEYPENLMVELTHDCNNNCLYCYQKSGSKNKLDVDRLGKKMIECRQAGTRYIEFSGGEPTLSPYLPELIKLAKREKYENISLLTNGRRVSYENYFMKLIDFGLKTIIFAVPGHTADLYKKITQTDKEGFNQLVEALKTAKEEKNKIEVGIVTVINEYNYRYLPEIVGWISGIKPSFVTLSYPIPLGKKLDQKNIPTYEKVYPFIKKALDRYGKKVKICIEGIPYCQLHRYEKYILNEMYRKDCLISNPDGRISNRLETMKLLSTKTKKCIDCKYEDRCGGFFVEYLASRNPVIEKKYFEEQKVALDIQSGNCDYDYVFCTRELNGKRYHDLKKDIAVVDYEKLKLFFETSSAVSKSLDIWGRERADEFKDIFKILGIAKKYFRNITLWSSGLKLNNATRIKRFLRSGVTEFEIPLYGASEKIHDSITRKRGSHKIVFSALRALDRLNVGVSLHFVILKDNFKELPEIMKLVSKYRRTTLTVWFYYPDPAVDHRGVNAYKKHCSSYSEIIGSLSQEIEKIGNLHLKLVFFPRCIFFKIKKIVKKAELVEPGFVRFMVAGSKDMKYKFLTGKGEFGAIYPTKCKACRLKNSCSGIFSDYIKIFGDGEIRPINK
jgi:MoaA/NifB/PqqE/SkfB family radical SAM enzyme